jgi:hypothetical protein
VEIARIYAGPDVYLDLAEALSLWKSLWESKIG